MKKVCILGASGMLGSMLTNYLSDKYQITATARSPVYFTEKENVTWHMFNANSGNLERVIDGADWVINAIGVIPQRYPMDIAQRHAADIEKNMFDINTLFPWTLAEVAREKGIHVIQIATDCVFSGKRGNYDEKDCHDPVDMYGATKANGEIKSDYVHYLRCSIVGTELFGCYSLLNWFLSRDSGAVVNGYTNHYWNGITTLQFARICDGLIENMDTEEMKMEMPHLQHIVPADKVSKYDLLRLFKDYFDVYDVSIRPYATETSIDRTLRTRYPAANRIIWSWAGYEEVPTISECIRELAIAYRKMGKKVVLQNA